MYKDFYLQFTDEAEASSILFTLPALDQNLEPVEGSSVPNYKNIDVLGVLYEQVPQDAASDYQPQAVPGWHVNVRVWPDENPTPLLPYVVTPKAPRRIWG